MNQSYADKNVLAMANNVLIDTYKDLLYVTKFKSLSDLHGIRQYNGGAAACVVATRFGKGLFTEDRENVSDLKRKCMQETRRADAALWVYNSTDFKWPHGDRLDHASRLIECWLKPLRKPLGGGVKLPPGESFLSARGRVSVFQKLNGPWTVTDGAKEAFATLIANTRYLRKAFYAKLRKEAHVRNANADLLIKTAYRRVTRFLRGVSDGSLVNHFGVIHSKNRAHALRVLMVISLADFVFYQVEGSRFSSVPKDTEKRRPINVEPLGNVVLQLSLGTQIKDLLRDRAANCLWTGQAHHRKMCRDMAYATVDFSGASDSISIGLFKRLFFRLPQLVNYILKIRSPKVQFTFETDTGTSSSDAAVSHNPSSEWVDLNKLSSMGNGFTFEVLTTILLSIARTFDPTARVYGDDVIIRKEYFAEYCAVCESLGFKVNRNKSFSNYGFRESCGAFYQEGFGEILSFEFDAVCNTERLFTAINKLYLLWNFYRHSQFPALRRVAAMCLNARAKLLSFIPSEKFLGPVTQPQRRVNTNGFEETKVTGSYIMDDMWLLLGCPTHIPRWLWEKVYAHLKGLGYAKTDIHIRWVVEGVDQLGSKTPRSTNSISRIGSYLYSGRVSPDIIRTNANERNYKTRQVVYLSCGNRFELDDFIRP